jgi:protein-disulfide isomerase
VKKVSLIAIVPLVVIGCFVLIAALNDHANNKAYEFDYDSLPSLGSEDAPVKIVEFGDYKCPACQHFNLNLLPEIEKDYIKTGKVQLHFMNYPFIAEDSARAARFGETVFQILGSEAFWSFNKLVFANQQDPSNERVDYMDEAWLGSLLDEVAEEDEAEQVLHAFRKDTYGSTIPDHVEKGRTSGVKGTPAVFINGVQVDDSMDLNEIKKAIDKALEDE